MSYGKTRITGLEDPSEGAKHVGSVHSFRSNTHEDHFVVSLNDGFGADDSPMGYVDKRAALDLAFHFSEVARDLGAAVNVVSDHELHRRVTEAFKAGQQAGHWDGRRSLRDELQAHLNTV